MANPVTWFEIIGKDAVGLQKFYKEVFDWKLSEPAAEMGMYSMLENEGHGFSRTENLLRAYVATDAFLDRYLLGRKGR